MSGYSELNPYEINYLDILFDGLQISGLLYHGSTREDELFVWEVKSTNSSQPQSIRSGNISYRMERLYSVYNSVHHINSIR